MTTYVEGERNLGRGILGESVVLQFLVIALLYKHGRDLQATSSSAILYQGRNNYMAEKPEHWNTSPIKQITVSWRHHWTDKKNPANNSKFFVHVKRLIKARSVLVCITWKRILFIYWTDAPVNVLLCLFCIISKPWSRTNVIISLINLKLTGFFSFYTLLNWHYMYYAFIQHGVYYLTH